MSLSEELTALATAPASLELMDQITKLDNNDLIKVTRACEETEL